MLSIIVPVYNTEKYLDQCVKSILNQNYSDFELLLVNDGSTDNSGIICDNYAKQDNRIKVFHKENAGQGIARNYGLNQSKGLYVWFIDSDDWIAENCLFFLMEELEKEPVDMLGFSGSEFREHNGQIGNPIKLKKISITNGNEYIKENSIITTTVWSFIYSTSFLKRENLQFEGDMIHEDDYFQLLCFLKVNSIRKIPFSFYYYRIRSGSTMTNPITDKRIYSYFKLIKLTCLMKNSRLNDELLDFLSWNYTQTMIGFMVKVPLDFYTTKKLLNDTKNIFPKSKVNITQSKVASFERYIYNISPFILFYFYKYFKWIHILICKLRFNQSNIDT